MRRCRRYVEQFGSLRKRRYYQNGWVLLTSLGPHICSYRFSWYVPNILHLWTPKHRKAPVSIIRSYTESLRLTKKLLFMLFFNFLFAAICVLPSLEDALSACIHIPQFQILTKKNKPKTFPTTLLLSSAHKHCKIKTLHFFPP